MVPVPRLRGRRLSVAILSLALTGAVTLPAPAFDLRVPPADIGDGRILVAQNQQSTAQLLVRLQDLESQVRSLTGQIEGLQFQLTQLQTMLEKQAKDYDLRFQDLEGGTPGKKSEAAVPAGGATPSDALPPDTAATDALPADAASAADPGAPVDVSGSSADPAPLSGDLGDPIGDSGDPLLKGGTDQLGTLTEGDKLTLDSNQPLVLPRDGSTISNGDAQAQYDAGQEAITNGDYALAEEQFGQFVKLFPEDARAADAVYWLGESYLQRQAYDEAAAVLGDGAIKYKDSKRLPFILLKLGVALVGGGEADSGCRMFFEVKTRYPDQSPTFKQRLADEQQKANCPVQ